jgi:hypothetical protein
MSWSLVQGVLPILEWIDQETEKRRGPTTAVEQFKKKKTTNHQCFGERGSVDEALYYITEGREFDSWSGHCNPSSNSTALGTIEPLTEMSTWILPVGKRLVAFQRHLWADFLENVAASMSHNRMGLHGRLQG